MALSAPASETYIFVSYATRDITLANDFVRHLEKSDIKCWIAARDIKLSEAWPTAIARAIPSASAVLLLLTESSNASREIAAEMLLAHEAHRPILTVVLSELTISPDLRYILPRPQRLQAERLSRSEILARVQEALSKILRGELQYSPPFAPAGELPPAVPSLTGALWRLYGSARARVVAFSFYALSAILPMIPGDSPMLDQAPYLLALLAGVTIVGVTRQVNVFVLFTIGFVQPVFMILDVVVDAPRLVLRYLGSNPPIPYGLACAAGGLLMSLRFGPLGLGPLSIGVWAAWLFPAWRGVGRVERFEFVVKLALLAVALVMLYFSLRTPSGTGLP